MKTKNYLMIGLMVVLMVVVVFTIAAIDSLSITTILFIAAGVYLVGKFSGLGQWLEETTPDEIGDYNLDEE